MYYLFSGLVFFLALLMTRFAELPANVTPILAAAIFAPKLVKNTWLQPFIPVVVLIVTDYFLGWYTAAPVVYACIIMASILSVHIKNLYITGVVSVLFWHVLVNGAVWYTGHVDLTLSQVYLQAIVFDLRLLVSTLVFLAILDYVDKLTKNLHNAITYALRGNKQ